ncbi:FAD-binding oxidoreductase [Paludifilum halophilum]|uniref:FAD-binding oxidoreductase n=1 Tax=Paludifilum halophilum TaxID=1642702 RepID=UPI001F0A2DF3|nr:FAD-binding oxidoreductase [Paludifilum halophilum]
MDGTVPSLKKALNALDLPKEGDKVLAREEQDVSKVMDWASRTGTAVVPEGKGAYAAYGNPVRRPAATLSLEPMQEGIDHSAGDLVVTVPAGWTLAELQVRLRQAGQMLPLDPPHPSVTTVGGAVALGLTGPKRLKYGAVRDTVIGLRGVLPGGEVIRSGGQVVKNVAGYDLNKLWVGSMGTLGVMTRCTFKLRPLPSTETALLVEVPDWSVMSGFCRQLLDAPLEPAALEVLNCSSFNRLSGGDRPAGPGVMIGFEDEEQAVRVQEDRVTELVEAAGVAVRERWRGNGASKAWEELGGLSPHALDEKPEEKRMAIRFMVRPGQTVDLLREVDRLCREKEVPVMIYGGAGTGIGRAIFEGKAMSLESVLRLTREMRDCAESRSGYAVIEHASGPVREAVSAWGRLPAGFVLMQGIKSKLDPECLLNPGRFVGGI